MRRTSEQVKNELDRLCACFEVIQDCMFNLEGSEIPYRTKDFREWREGMLRLVDEKKVTLSQVLSGVREGLNDMNEMLSHLSEDRPALAAEVLSQYKECTGRDYWDDAGRPKKLVKSVLRRGHVREETEFRLLNGVVSDLAQNILTPEEVEKAQSLLRSFELGSQC